MRAADVSPDLIILTDRHVEQVRSKGANLTILVEGVRYFGPVTGTNLTQVVKLRDEAKAASLRDEDILVDHVGAESRGWIVVLALAVAAAVAALLLRMQIVFYGGVVAALLAQLTGLLRWPRSVSCRMRLLCQDTGQANRMLAAVSAADATLENVEWIYEVEKPHGEWIDECLRRANARAERVAKALQVRILGVHRYTERWSVPGQPAEAPPPDLEAFDLSADVTPEVEEGTGRRRVSRGSRASIALQSADRASVAITVAYRISERTPQSKARPAPGV